MVGINIYKDTAEDLDDLFACLQEFCRGAIYSLYAQVYAKK